MALHVTKVGRSIVCRHARLAVQQSGFIGHDVIREAFNGAI